jgi:hypothetical protein
MAIFSGLTLFSCQANNDHAPNPGSDDCYNRVTSSCNERHPGKTMSDKEYRDCINGGLDWCDTNEPAREQDLSPVFDSEGRMVAMMKAKSSAPDAGPGDCYNRVTQTCNGRFPGKDWGDPDYKNCINNGLAWCDKNEPARGGHVFPVFEASGRVLMMKQVNSDAPDSGTGDCYNRVTETCNRKHPGKNLGDQVYRDCINGGLDWCDVNEPAREGQVFPGVDVSGRYVVKARQ